MNRPRHQTRPNRRRGGAYILVLGVAMLLAVLGMAGMMSARVTHRQATVGSSATDAMRLAESAVELALHEMAGDPGWRDNHASGEWAAPKPIGGGSVWYALVDVGDGDLANDPDDPVRIYGRAERGGSARIIRADVDVSTVEGVVGLTNGGFESGTAPWFTYQDSGVVMPWTTAPHGGSQNVIVTGRASPQTSLAQDVTDQLQNGQSYNLRAYVQTVHFWGATVVGLAIESDDGPDQQFTVTGPAGVLPIWGEVSGTVTPTWDGELLQAYFFVQYTESNVDFMVDDASMSAEAASTFEVDHGSWRRVLVQDAPALSD